MPENVKKVEDSAFGGVSGGRDVKFDPVSKTPYVLCAICKKRIPYCPDINMAPCLERARYYYNADHCEECLAKHPFPEEEYKKFYDDLDMAKKEREQKSITDLIK